ncbi:MAG TPA: T9SS type A sorting domain-containing protein [Bacteroidia bacterium]|jgi:hypothetical protein|nr:T9SS type A sorting domain-containing protein [Bacteroidia bacterium]
MKKIQASVLLIVSFLFMAESHIQAQCEALHLNLTAQSYNYSTGAGSFTMQVSTIDAESEKVGGIWVTSCTDPRAYGLDVLSVQIYSSPHNTLDSKAAQVGNGSVTSTLTPTYSTGYIGTTEETRFAIRWTLTVHYTIDPCMLSTNPYVFIEMKEAAFATTLENIITLSANNTSISGISEFCVPTNPTGVCTVASSYPLTGPYTWSVSNTAWKVNGGTTAVTSGTSVTITPPASGESTCFVSVTGAGICSSTVFPMGSASSLPAEPGGMTYQRENYQCYYNPVTPALTNVQSYQWSLNNFATIDDQTQTNVSLLEFMGNTVHTVYIRTDNACGVSATRSVTSMTPPVPSGCAKSMLEETSPATVREFSIFPNPANTSFHISLPAEIGATKITLVNMAGQVVQSLSTQESDLTVETLDLPVGLYIIQINSESFQTIKKIQVCR